MTRRRWSDPETQATLAEMSAAGFSAGQIADKIGATKDAVASAMSRYGLFASSRPERKSVTLAEVKTMRNKSDHDDEQVVHSLT